jgi:hypothetical protein
MAQTKPTPKNLTPIPPVEVDPPKPKTLTERFIEVLEDFAEERGLDVQLTFDQLARSVRHLDELYKNKLKIDDERRRHSEFEQAFEQRKAEFETALAQSGEPYFIVKRQWVSSRRNVVAVEGFQKDIFAKEVK